MNGVRSKLYNYLFSFALMDERKKKVPMILIFSLLFISLNLEVASADEFSDAWEAFMVEYRIILAGFAGVGAVTSILVFIYHFIKLGTMPSHPILRREVMSNMLISGICTALLGGITLILTLFYGIMFEPTAPNGQVSQPPPNLSDFAPDDPCKISGTCTA